MCEIVAVVCVCGPDPLVPPATAGRGSSNGIHCDVVVALLPPLASALSLNDSLGEHERK